MGQFKGVTSSTSSGAFSLVGLKGSGEGEFARDEGRSPAGDGDLAGRDDPFATSPIVADRGDYLGKSTSILC